MEVPCKLPVSQGVPVPLSDRATDLDQLDGDLDGIQNEPCDSQNSLPVLKRHIPSAAVNLVAVWKEQHDWIGRAQTALLCKVREPGRSRHRKLAAGGH